MNRLREGWYFRLEDVDLAAVLLVLEFQLVELSDFLDEFEILAIDFVRFPLGLFLVHRALNRSRVVFGQCNENSGWQGFEGRLNRIMKVDILTILRFPFRELGISIAECRLRHQRKSRLG